MGRSSWLFCIATLQVLLLPLIFLQLIEAAEERPICDSTSSSSLEPLHKIDCHPEQEANERECLNRGCCWLVLPHKQQQQNETLRHQEEQQQQQDDNNQPRCFFPANFNCYNIKLVVASTDDDDHDDGDGDYDDGEQKDKKHELNEAEKETQEDEDYDMHLDMLKTMEQVEGEREKQEEEGEEGEEGGGGDGAGSKKYSSGREGRRKSLTWLLERRPDCPASGFHDDAKRLKLKLNVYGRSIINIKISDPDKHRFEPKLPEINLPDEVESASQDGISHNSGSQSRYRNINSNKQQQQQQQDESSSMSADNLFFGGTQDQEPLMKVELNNQSGLLRMIHQNSSKILFEVHLHKLIYSSQFIQLSTKLSSSLVYGLGQQMSQSLLKNKSKTYTMFNHGHPPQSDGRTSYSSYPFYINVASTTNTKTYNNDSNILEDAGKPIGMTGKKLMATGALMLNSNAMDVVVRSSPVSLNDADADDNDYGEQPVSITWRLVGGIVNLFLFAGPEPHDVIQQYQSLVGRPTLPPAWALGYHQSRLNYRSLLHIKQAWARTRSSNIPIESIWTDLDFLRDSNSYSLSDPQLDGLVRAFQVQFGMHYMPLVDPTISLTEDPSRYEALKLASSMDLFAWNSQGQQVNGESKIATVRGWSERMAILDFTNPQILPYLVKILQDYKSKLNFDGLWLDMNEPEVFANENASGEKEGKVCSQDDQLQYWPGERNLNDRTLCMSIEFEAGKHYDIHNLYAFYQSKAHYEALRVLNGSARRPFLISRAQFVGQGKYAGSWLGDLGSTWEHLRWSLVGTIQSNWFGQPMIGADICGFFGSTSDELCSRWFSLGAFYPLARNHNDGQARDQDPGALSEDVQTAARVALMKRYSLLPYLYSLFYDNYLNGEPVISSMMFSFFNLIKMNQDGLSELSLYENQLVWGKAIVIAPILEPDTEFRNIYLPAGRWYDVSIGLPGTDLNEGPYDGLISNWPLVKTMASDQSNDSLWPERVDGLRKPIDCSTESDGCLLRDQYTPLGSINIFLRGGSIIPTFRNITHTNSINQIWAEPSFFLEVALNENEDAFGELYWDSGESEPESKKYDEVSFWAQKNRLTITMMTNKYKEALRFDGFVVYGAKLASQTKHKMFQKVYKNVRLNFEYDAEREILTCVFKSSTGDHQDYLIVKRYENLIIEWSDSH